ncbi:rhodanese-like domain-containing protein [Clostridiaceae bacterium HSG29]|nr:rhodanese-like domain-containing protein [Clostridiaceae bacterium HSG29]
MNFNKRILSLLLILVLSFSLVACGTQAPEVEKTSMEVTEVEEKAPEVEEAPQDINVIEDAVKSYYENKPAHSYLMAQVDFVEMVKADEAMTILDIRQPDAYAEGHVKGAVNLPWGTAISDNLANIPNDKPVFVYCYSGQTAGQTVANLNIAGFNARSVKYGWNFGISKVEGVEAVTVTEATTFDGAVTEINPTIQEAMDVYYSGLADVKETKFKNYKISEDNLKEMIDTEEDFYLLSIRKKDDYDKGHIKTAHNLPYGTAMFDGFADLPKDKKIVVQCYSGQTAGQTTAALKLLGFDAVSLNGGMGTTANAPLGWATKGYEVESSIIVDAVKSYYENKPAHSYLMAQVDFVEMVKADEAMTILDIRQPDAYAEGHVKGAVNLPWGTAISDNLANIPNDKPVFVYCYSGQTAGQTVANLNIAGFNARSVKYGWNFGISKVEGVEAVTVTEATTFDGAVTEINPTIQEAMDAYFSGLADVKETKFKNYKISEDNLKEMIDTEEDFYLLSIRKKDDYDKGHIKTAKNLPYGTAMFDGFADLPKDKKIVVQCYSGQTAGQTTAALKLLGYDAVSLNGGMGTETNAPLGWTAKGYDVVQ